MKRVLCAVCLLATPPCLSADEIELKPVWLRLESDKDKDKGKELAEGQVALPKLISVAGEEEIKGLPRQFDIRDVALIEFGKPDPDPKKSRSDRFYVNTKDKAGKPGRTQVVRGRIVEIGTVSIKVDNQRFKAEAGVGVLEIWFINPNSIAAKALKPEEGAEKGGEPKKKEEAEAFVPLRMRVPRVRKDADSNEFYPQLWKLPTQDLITKSGKQPEQEDYENSKVYIFNAPARFPFPQFGALGERVETVSAVIHEEMRLVVWDGGWYEVVFVLGVPNAPVTLRLQLQVERIDCPGDPIVLTLPPIALDPRLESKGNWVGSVHRIHHEGFSARLRDHWHELGDPLTSKVLRSGTARFGPLP